MNVRVFEKKKTFSFVQLAFFIINFYSLFFLQYMYLLCIIQYLPAPALIHYAYSAPVERLGSDLTVSWTCSVAYQTMLWLFIVGQWRAGSVFLVNLHLPMPVNSTFTFNKSNF